MRELLDVSSVKAKNPVLPTEIDCIITVPSMQIMVSRDLQDALRSSSSADLGWRLLIVCFANNVLYVFYAGYFFVGSFAERWIVFAYTLAGLHAAFTNDLLLLMFSTPVRAEAVAVLKRTFGMAGEGEVCVKKIVQNVKKVEEPKPQNPQ